MGAGRFTEPAVLVPPSVNFARLLARTLDAHVTDVSEQRIAITGLSLRLSLRVTKTGRVVGTFSGTAPEMLNELASRSLGCVLPYAPAVRRFVPRRWRALPI